MGVFVGVSAAEYANLQRYRRTQGDAFTGTGIDTTIPLRALAIVMIVGSHTDLWTLAGGAHVLLAVAGANFARFQLVDEGARERLGRIGRAVARIAIPSILWIGAVAVVAGGYPWRSVFLLNDVLGARTWSEPAWHFWFIEVLLLVVLAPLLVSVVVRAFGWTSALLVDGPAFDENLERAARNLVGVQLLPTIGEGSAAGRIMVRHRTIVCKGFVEARDDTDYWLARATVENLVPAYTEVPFVVHEPTGTQQVMVRSSPGSPRIRDNAGHFEFQLTLVALDPTKHPVA